MRRLKKIAWCVAGVILFPVVLFALLVVLFYIPAVQQWAVGKVAAYASEQTGLDIRLERIRIRFPLDLDLQNFCATTPPDTIVSVQHALVDLDFSHILDCQLGVDALELQGGVVDTRDLISTVIVKGRLGKLRLACGDVALRNQHAELSGITLDDCDVDISMRDTTVVDTTESAPVMWTIGVGDVALNNTRVAFHTVGDSLCVGGDVNHLLVSGGDVNLREGVYGVERLELDADTLYLVQRLNESTPVTSIGKIQLSAKNLLVDDTHLVAPDFRLATPHSHIDGKLNLDWAALTPRERGHMDVDVDASLGHHDLMTLAADYLTPELLQLIPQAPPVTLDVKARGNVDCVEVEECRLAVMPLGEATVNGTLTNVLVLDSLGADLKLKAQTRNLNPVHRMLGLSPTIQFPDMHLSGDVHLHDQRYAGDLRLLQGSGSARARGSYDARTEAYRANLDVRNLNLHRFLPRDSVYNLTGRARLSGVGTDLLSRRARANAEVEVDHLRYGRNNIDNVRLNAHARNGEALVNLYSENDVLRADACATLQLDREITGADFSLGVSHIDFHALGLTDKPLAMSLQLQADGNSNLKERHELKGRLQAIELILADTVYYPSDMDLSLLMATDTLYAEVTAGDLEMMVVSREGLDRLLASAEAFVDEAKRQFMAHHLAQDTLKSLLPRVDIHLKSGNDNTLAHIIRSMGYQYDRINLNLAGDPQVGLNGDGYVHALNTGAILLDTIQFHIHQDTANVMRFDGRVRNGPRNRQVVFESNLMAELTPTGADASINFFDAKGLKGVDLGAQLFLEDEGYRVHLSPLNPIIAYRRFKLNDNNYIFLHDDMHVEADLDLLADDGTGFKLYSTPNAEARQDITLSVHDFNLDELTAVLPYMPKVGGTLAGDFHLVQQEQSTSVLVDAGVQKLTYEGASLDNMAINALYLPNADGTHYVDGIILHNGSEVGTLSGTYNPAGQGTIEAQATLERLPLSLANGFIPDNTVELDGYATGEMDVRGRVSNPLLNGSLVTDSMYLNSDMYSLHLRFPNDTIGVRESFLDFDRIEAYSTGRNPLVLDGNINFADLERILLNLNLSARNFELINAPKSPGAVAYGKVFVDLGARLTGTLDDMLLRGRLDVLGNTDVTYVLADSPLTVDDHLSEIVTFVDFADTLATEPVKTSPQNIDMQMLIDIEQAAQVHCLLSTDGTNHIDLEGGGELTMGYTTQDGLQLYGRYTIVSGLMNYTLMVMSLKNFAIQNGSYAEFTGDIMNPRLNISASERVKTTVYENDVPRSVNFDVGLTVSQTLNDMGLAFNIEAPSDMTISNQLATMTDEERGKVAVTMLATGLYLTESGNGTTGFSSTNALNSFLQSQIAAISNKALSTIDLNFGIDNTESASGATQTDYSFSFAKRFWGNRISLIIGGKVSSGSEVQNTGQSIINNVSIEYRLDKSATRYVRVYYDRDSESLLEGEITEMGAGLVLRKKSNRLGELFIFRKKE